MLVEILKIEGQPIPVNKAAKAGDHDLLLRDLDCAVINLCLDTLDEAEGDAKLHDQTVRGVFVEGLPAFEGARIMTKTHVQIAVRDTSCILGYFRPAGDYTSE